MESNSVCKRVIDKIRFLFMITDRIGRHEVPLPISRNRYNVRENKWILFSERAFELTKCPKLGKISLQETLSSVTNSSVLENALVSRVTGYCYGYCDKFSLIGVFS